MATDKRVTFNEAGDPVVTVTITGWNDAFRFAWAISHLQCDFMEIGRLIGGSLKRRIGARQFAELNKRFTGERTHHWVREAYNDER